MTCKEHVKQLSFLHNNKCFQCDIKKSLSVKFCILKNAEPKAGYNCEYLIGKLVICLQREDTWRCFAAMSCVDCRLSEMDFWSRDAMRAVESFFYLASYLQLACCKVS